VANPEGVLVDDIFAALMRDYEEFLSQYEFDQLTIRQQDQIKRTRQSNEMQAPYPGSGTPPGLFRRYDFLRNMIFFHKLEKDDGYAKKRLNYTAPNIFVMHLLS